jgi:hypothetical protein
VLADEAVQRGGDPGLNAVILVVAIVTSLVVMCCAYYTVRFMKVKVKSVALSKQVTPNRPRVVNARAKFPECKPLSSGMKPFGHIQSGSVIHTCRQFLRKPQP